MKKALALLLASVMLLAVLPAGAADMPGGRTVSTSTVIDTDGSDGYSGDYVVICNPNTSAGSSMSTGNMSGKIVTELDYEPVPAEAASDELYVIDVDGRLAEEAQKAGLGEAPAEKGESRSISFEVGDTRVFGLAAYSPLPSYDVEFKVLAKGEHCYVWTPVSHAANVWPLDVLDPEFAQMAADTFDSKYDLMQSSFGEHENGYDGDGRISLLYYNIDDGWAPGASGYVAGYFSAFDLYFNGLPIVNIDTYPGVYYTPEDGDPICDVARTYNTTVHEYQHLINYSVCGSADTWLNECMSAAAEEICFPGSSVSRRIQSWINHSYNDNDDWNDPPAETEYEPSYTMQNGASMYDWNNNIEIADILVLYAQVSLFAQYLYTHFGNGIFRTVLEDLGDGNSTLAALQRATGVQTAELTARYRVALTANTTQDEYEGLYGFVMQPGYDPEEYHGVENLYDLLCPVVFTGVSCQIKGGGAICVKPIDGVYYPPSGASSGLRYYGVTRSTAPQAMTDLSLTPDNITLYVGDTAVLTAVPTPANTDYTLSFASSAPDVASVRASGNSVMITGLAAGYAVITVTAVDNVGGGTYTASAYVTVTDRIPGDVDGNGVVNANDALKVLRASLGLITLTPEEQAAADIDMNGSVTANDALAILRLAMMG